MLIFTFGRFNPITSGHLEHFAYIDQLSAGQHPYCLYTSTTVDNDKNPLTAAEKIAFAQEAGFGMRPAKNMFEVIDINEGKYTEMMYVAGGDYFDNGVEESLFNRMVVYAAKKGITLSYASSGARTPGISGTEMRHLAKNNDWDGFVAMSGMSSNRLLRQTFETLNKRMNSSDTPHATDQTTQPTKDR